MRILVTGGAGMLGVDARQVLAAGGHEVFWADKTVGDDLSPAGLDIEDWRAVLDYVRRVAPDVVLHAAAYTNVEGCERDPDIAFKVNGFGSWTVAHAAQSVGAALVVVSTDFVFDGAKGHPYLPSDPPHPLSAYGASKLAGERLAMDACKRTFVVRTSWLFGVHGRNFPYTMLGQAAKGAPLSVVADQTGCPTYTVDLVTAILAVVVHGVPGIYHASNAGATTWFDFARATLDRGGFAGYPVEKLTSAEAAQRFDIRTVRPAYSVMDTGRVAEAKGAPMRLWTSALDDFIEAARLADKLPRPQTV